MGRPLYKEVRNNQNHDYPVAAINILATASQRLYNLPHLASTSGKDVREGGSEERIVGIQALFSGWKSL